VLVYRRGAEHLISDLEGPPPSLVQLRMPFGPAMLVTRDPIATSAALDFRSAAALSATLSRHNILPCVARGMALHGNRNRPARIHWHARRRELGGGVQRPPGSTIAVGDPRLSSSSTSHARESFLFDDFRAP
jgi:hypothetical protein